MSGVVVEGKGLDNVFVVQSASDALNPEDTLSINTEKGVDIGNGSVELAAVPSVSAELSLNKSASGGALEESVSLGSGSGLRAVLQELLGEDAELGLVVAVVTSAAGGLAALDLGEDRFKEEESSEDSGKDVHLEKQKATRPRAADLAFVWTLSGAKSHIA